MKLKVTDISNKAVGEVEIDDAVFADIFGRTVRKDILARAVNWQLAKRRSGNHKTKEIGDISGTTKKPYAQKGTGNARQGSTRAPHYSGGGVALAPKPRKYTQKTPRKMIRGALYSALSDRAAGERIIVLDGWDFDAPKTAEAAKVLQALDLTDTSVLLVVGPEDENTILSFRNIPNVQLIEAAELNAYDVLCNDWIVFTKDNLPGSAKAETAETAPAAAETTEEAAS
jgi:large subunit ribosomal protein L4